MMRAWLVSVVIFAFMTSCAFASDDDFVSIKGGTFLMGSPESENWRGVDETQHEVTVGDFSIGKYEVTQSEYEAVMGGNPASFGNGGRLPVENVSWLDAVRYCNARSEKEGLTPAYTIDGSKITWNQAADGYRLPTEAEWEYACRAGTAAPFNTETSIGADEANYYGHYPYEIEEAQRDQHRQARPKLKGHIKNIAQYDTILLGYPNWWASIPMPIASFLEEYDLSGKTILPFCSHGGGRFGQSLTAIAKLAPKAVIKEGLSVHYGGGSGLSGDIARWLSKNGVAK